MTQFILVKQTNTSYINVIIMSLNLNKNKKQKKNNSTV